MAKPYGVCQVVYGEAARKAQLASAASLFGKLPIAVAGHKSAHFHPSHHPQDVYWNDAQRARWAKVTLPRWTPFVYTCYLDADTRVFGDLTPGFDLLEKGADLVIAIGEHQGDELWWHVGEKERHESLDELPYTPVGLQGGLLFFYNGPLAHSFFDCWKEEWLRYQGEDQAALIRALHRYPLRLALLGYPWNAGNGAVVSHYYGTVRVR